jgi:proteasome lid subunit RPN8/RPN11
MIEPERRTTAAWRAPGHPLTIEYSIHVLEELRAATEDGFQKIPHGGIEVGALLFGTEDETLVRVLEWRPIECDHSNGPGFNLSPRDLAALEALIAQCRHAPELQPLQLVGWFHSHTRSGIFLSQADLAIHDRFFPGPRKIALVMRMTKDPPARAGFFVRDSDGSIRTESSPAEFPVPRDSSALLAPVRPTAARRAIPPRRVPRPVPPAGEPERVGNPALDMAVTPPLFGQSMPAPAPPRRAIDSRLVAALLVSMVCLGALAWSVTLWFPLRAKTVSLRIADVNDRLEIRWDKSSPLIATADRAELMIHDGDKATPVELSAEDLRTGSVVYTPAADDVQLRFEAFRGATPVVQESARLLGRTPRPQLPAAGASAGDSGAAELDRLKKQLADETRRGDELRRQIREAERRGKGPGRK